MFTVTATATDSATNTGGNTGSLTIDTVAPTVTVNALVTKTNTPTLTGARGSATSTRFDVQLTQGLPFLAPLTRADWELLLAVRNMFYEASQAGFLDELAVQDPPTRVVGGISVKF